MAIGSDPADGNEFAMNYLLEIFSHLYAVGLIQNIRTQERVTLLHVVDTIYLVCHQRETGGCREQKI